MTPPQDDLSMGCAVFPRLVVSGLSGGGGKTLLSLGLARALRQRGREVVPYKKGPDYIDAAWLGLAARRRAVNLDPFFLPDERLLALFQHAFRMENGQTPADRVAVIEGNRGLYDGRDAAGSCSTARLARALDAPVILALNCTKMTRTAAAVVAGLAAFEPVRLAGVVLNQVGSARHGRLARQAIESHTGIPVLGEIPRLAENPIPERHMGLLSVHAEREDAAERENAPGAADESCAGRHAGTVEAVLDGLAALINESCDVPALLDLACAAPPLPEAPPFWPENEVENGAEASGNAEAAFRFPLPETTRPQETDAGTARAPAARRAIRPPRPRIGYVRDAALWFYYEENLEALRGAGAERAELTLDDGAPWPDLDGLYLGGGFPEMLAASISASPRLADIRVLSEQNRPIYAECGGLMILCRTLRVGGADFPMADIFPARAEFCPKPQGLGYVEAEVTAANPFHPAGARFRGHEFHYSRCVPLDDLACALALHPGRGITGQGNDGLLHRRVFAAYTHIFAPAVPHWATRFVAACRG